METNIDVNGEVETTQEEVKTYTQEEVLKLLQSESDLNDRVKIVYRSTMNWRYIVIIDTESGLE